jgi:hypothetical protein
MNTVPTPTEANELVVGQVIPSEETKVPEFDAQWLESTINVARAMTVQTVPSDEREVAAPAETEFTVLENEQWLVSVLIPSGMVKLTQKDKFSVLHIGTVEENIDTIVESRLVLLAKHVFTLFKLTLPK